MKILKGIKQIVILLMVETDFFVFVCSLGLMLCMWSGQLGELAQTMESKVNLMQVRLQSPSSHWKSLRILKLGSQLQVFQKDHTGCFVGVGGCVHWSRENLEAEGTLQVILPRKGSERGPGDIGQEMNEAVDFIGPGPGPVVCSYRSRKVLWKPVGIVCNSSGGET